MAEERVQRKLTTVLAADVEGYSRLMGSHGECHLWQERLPCVPRNVRDTHELLTPIEHATEF